ncbi:TlpA disulfide reductase family protein [Thalassotalea mangrovi]|uniref:TlpA family protein disulfide reductase n=1 Tax=Thalassotalea mangrovi TaxID=2572245 RepID=A0A4U1B2L8_9GAMM|nr:TlpA disulfide reductase family protein [Thalassotalea mangrovi]TKB43729.1 TlpA family protein disulfide reductase [Thalassotalea mangrovi]
MSTFMQILKSLFLQLLIIAIVFNGVSALREMGMLSSWMKQQAPDFHLTSLHSEQVNLQQMLGKQKTVLYFFAPWCSVCKFSMGNLQSLHDKKASADFKVIAIALDYVDHDEVTDFVKDMELTMPVLFGNQALKQRYQVSAYPSYYVVDNNQQVIHRSMGYSTELGLFLRTL